MLLLSPIQIDSRKIGAIPIFGDGIMFLEDTTKVMGVLVTNILHIKVINDETENDRAPFVAPEAGGGKHLVVASRVDALDKEVIGNLSRLRKSVDAFAFIEVYPPVMRKGVEIIFMNKFLQDIRQANTCVFAATKGGAQVEARDVN